MWGGFSSVFIIGWLIITAIISAGSYLISERHYKKISDGIARINLHLKKSEEEEKNFDKEINQLREFSDSIQNDIDKAKDRLSKDALVNLKKIVEEFIFRLEETKQYKVNRSEFLGNVAHELNTPIFTIQLSLETLIDGALNDKNVNIDFLKKALKSTKRLAELSNDLIEISKLEMGKRVSKRYYPINELIRESAGSVIMIAQNKNIELKYEFNTKDTERVLCDSDMIKQVIVNLVENAAKYTPDGGEIIISTELTERGVRISVKDNGIGIPEKDIDRIFERFYRVDKNRSRNMGGSGLGLAIVKHSLELNGSSITVTSKENQGSKFEFVLPK